MVAMTMDARSFAKRTTGVQEVPIGNPTSCLHAMEGCVMPTWDGQKWLITTHCNKLWDGGIHLPAGWRRTEKPYVIVPILIAVWFQLFALTAASLDDESGRARTIDLQIQTGKWNSMVVYSKGTPHITYDPRDGGVNSRFGCT